MPALTETKIQGDITRLKNKIVEAESHLKESKKLSVKLREAMEKKIQQISAVEAHTAEEIEAYRWKKAELAERRKQLEEESKKLIDDLRNEKNRKREEISSFDILQYENERLHIKLKEVSKLRYENLQSQTLEKEKKKQKDFDSRMAMEEIMRKMIKNSDEGYKRAAIEKMHQEAAQADTENQRILAEFNMREKQTVSLIHQQLHSFNKLKKLRIERDVFASAIQCQRSQLTKLIRSNENQQDDTENMENLLESLKQEIFDLKTKARRKRDSKAEVLRLKNLLNAVEAKRKTFYDASVYSGQELLRQTMATADQLTKAQNESLSQSLNDVNLA